MVFQIDKKSVQVQGVILERPLLICGKNQEIKMGNSERIHYDQPFQSKSLDDWVILYDFKYK